MSLGNYTCAAAAAPQVGRGQASRGHSRGQVSRGHSRGQVSMGHSRGQVSRGQVQGSQQLTVALPTV